MAFPEPEAGLVIAYSYLWRDEALGGREEGRKDRPCVVVLAVVKVDGRTEVTVAPITHAPPPTPDLVVEIPQDTKRRLGLDAQRSWIVASDLNVFEWPGVDLRPTRRGGTAYSYGLLPAALYRQLRDKVVALARAGQARATKRSE